MSKNQIETLRLAFEEGSIPPFDSLSMLDDPKNAVEIALATPTGRRWLRSLTDLDTAMADRLLAFDEDFRRPRRDSTLERVVNQASMDAVIAHSNAIAAGPAATELWNRLAADQARMNVIAEDVVTSGDARAAENTLYLLVLDTLDPFELGDAQRASLAHSGLEAVEPAIRSLAAEYLFDNDVETLAASAHRLVLDSDERVRGLAWSAGFRVNPGETFDAANSIVGDESADLQARRSALAALGTHFETRDLVDLLSFFVTHPSEPLAVDAGNLLYRLHRHPTIATAAAASPHQSVREVGQFLLDPYRGSPAAGGSRPGDPTSSDIFAQMLRQTESNDANDEPG